MKLISAMCGLALLAAPAWGAESDAPLAPGRPAGVTQAQIDNHKLEYVLIGIGTVILSVGAVWWINRNNTSSAAAAATTSP
jgi:hypothetical protein